METQEILQKLTQDQIRDLIKTGSNAELEKLFEECDAREASYAIAHLSLNERVRLMDLLSPELAAEVLEEIPTSYASDIVSELEVDQAVSIVNEMDSDEQADLLMDLHEDEAEAILAGMDFQDAQDLRKLIEFDPDTAGGIMVTEFLSLSSSLTAAQAITYLRSNQAEIADYQIKYLYVVNPKSELLGVVQMQDLLFAESNMSLGRLYHDAKAFGYQTTLEDLEGFFEGFDFIGVPVVDDDGRMIGAVLRRDVLKASSERLSKEHLESQGIIGGDELRTMPVWFRSKRRLSWLSVNILLNIIAASVIAFHQDTLSSVIALAVFLPIISDMSGCSGNQAVAVSMRELSIGTVRPKEILTVLGQELSVGLINGLVLGSLIAVAAWMWQGNIFLGVVAGSALALNTLVAVSLGGTLPLILKSFNIDPALASGPILTTVTDMLGFFLTLTFATMALHQLTSI